MIRLAVLLCCIFTTANAIIVNNIQIEGIERIEKHTVLTYLDIKNGDDVNDDLLSKGLSRLYATKFFADVAITMNDNTVIIKIKENPIIADVKFNGIKTSIAKSLKSEMHTKDRGIYSKDNIKFDTESIKSFFVKSGSLNVTVIPRVKVLDKNRVEIIFDVDEGNQAQVDDVLFVGNKEFSDFSLIKKLSLRGVLWWDLFSYGNVYDEQKIEYDKDLIKNLYLDNGYADFKFNSVIAEYNKEVSRFVLSYFMSEGEVYTFGESKIDSQIEGFSSDKLPLDLIESIKNKQYDNSKITKTIRNISDFLANRGFVNAQITPIITKTDRIADISYLIRPSNIAYISKIEISGNYKTHDHVIRREMLLSEGDLYRTDLIALSKRRILMLDFFDDVTIIEKPVDKNTIELEISIKERTRADGINLNAGYTTLGGIIYGIGLTKKNLFGRGYSGSIQFQNSIFLSQYSASVTNPRLFNSDLSLTLEASYTTFGSALANLPFNNTTRSIGARIGYPITEKLYQYWGLRLQDDSLAISANIGSTLYAQMSNYAISDVVSHTLVYDDRDHPLLPTSGFIARMTNSLSGFTGIGGQKYISNDFAFAFYTPTINSDFILLLAFQGGHVQGLGGDQVLFQNRYSVGYQNFRGFYYMGLGPRVQSTDSDGNVSYFYGGLKGNTYAVGTVELSIPLPIPKEHMVRGSFFCDFGTSFGYDGQAYYKGSTKTESVVDTASLRLAVGFGLTWIGPIGPIKIDFAQPLLHESYDQLQMFRITFQPGPF